MTNNQPVSEYRVDLNRGESIAWQLRRHLDYLRPELVTDADVDSAFEKLATSSLVKESFRDDEEGVAYYTVDDPRQAIMYVNVELAHINAEYRAGRKTARAKND